MFNELMSKYNQYKTRASNINFKIKYEAMGQITNQVRTS